MTPLSDRQAQADADADADAHVAACAVSAPGVRRARPWVLLRGLSRSAEHWGDFAARLQAATGAPVLCIDLPGNGAAARQTSPLSIEGMLAPVRARLIEASLPGPVHVLALSMGGMLACEWALRFPGELASLVLVNSSLRGLNGLRHRLRPRAWPALLPLLLWPVSAEHHERTVHRLTSARPETQEAVVARWLAIRKLAPVSRSNLLRQLLAAARYAAPPRPPAVPVLVLNGAADRLVDPRCSIDIARRWQATLQVHPHAGHDLPLDEPAWMLAQLQSWLERVDA